MNYNILDLARNYVIEIGLAIATASIVFPPATILYSKIAKRNSKPKFSGLEKELKSKYLN